MMPSFDSIRTAELADRDVSTSRMFGTDCLKVRGKVYAMEFKGQLVVKLSKARAEEFVSKGFASAFDPGHGRPMKQWISIAPECVLDWSELVNEAKALIRP